MELKSAAFGSPRELVNFINDNNVPQAQVVAIYPCNGQWHVFYYA